MPETLAAVARPRMRAPRQVQGLLPGPATSAVPHGAEAALAERLGLGTIKTVSVLLLDPPLPEWVDAAGGKTHAAAALAGERRQACGAACSACARTAAVEAARAHQAQGRRHRRARGLADPRGAEAASSPTPTTSVRGYGNLLVTVHPRRVDRVLRPLPRDLRVPGPAREARSNRRPRSAQTGIATRCRTCTSSSSSRRRLAGRVARTRLPRGGRVKSHVRAAPPASASQH